MFGNEEVDDADAAEGGESVLTGGGVGPASAAAARARINPSARRAPGKNVHKDM